MSGYHLITAEAGGWVRRVSLHYSFMFEMLPSRRILKKPMKPSVLIKT